MVEWWNGGMVEWWNGGMVEWWNGGMVEWWNIKINDALTKSVIDIR